MKERKNVLLADCEAGEVDQLAAQLVFQSRPFDIKSHVANWKRTGKWSELKRYFVYFAVAFRYFVHRKDYNAIIGWQQFYALIYCFFCEVFAVSKKNVVVALNFTYKEKRGKFAKPYRWFMGKCVSNRYMDYLHVLSSDYADSIHKEFGFPRERIIVSHFGVKDRYAELNTLPVPDGFEKESYALAIGRSNRDYAFLIKAWEQIQYPLVIISDTYQGNVTSKNITLMKNVAGAESEPWIVNCSLMILPIEDGKICSGDTVLLTAMSLKRRIIVTKPSTLEEMYVIDGENAVLSEKNLEQFRVVVDNVLFTETYSGLGERARESYLSSYTLGSMGKKLTLALERMQTLE